MSAPHVPEALGRAVVLSRLEELERRIDLIGQQCALLESAISVQRALHTEARRLASLLREALTEAPRA